MTDPNHDGLSSELWRQLRDWYAADHQLERKPSAESFAAALPDLTHAFRTLHRPLVYTAFDGDLFALAAQMRSFVLRHGFVPANPESIVGYHDSVCAHGVRKDLVLRDDLAILNRCDRLWIFTDVEPDPSSVTQSLAEGVLVELLFYLARREHLGQPSEVLFIPTANLLGDPAPAVTYPDDYATTRAKLGTDQCGIAKLLDDIGLDEPKLPKVAYIAHDPLDAKHVHWLRPFAYRHDCVPLVPTLALELSDAQLVWSVRDAAAQAMIARLALLRLADQLWILPPQQGRDDSYTVQLIRWLWPDSAVKSEQKWWSEMDIPKATSARWHITDREARAQHA